MHPRHAIPLTFGKPHLGLIEPRTIRRAIVLVHVRALLEEPGHPPGRRPGMLSTMM